MTKDMIEKIKSFIETEKKFYNMGYYNFEPNIDKELINDVEYRNLQKERNQRFDDFQHKVIECFVIGENTLDIKYLIPNKCIQNWSEIPSGVNPSDIVFDVINSLIMLINIETHTKLIMNVENNSMRME